MASAKASAECFPPHKSVCGVCFSNKVIYRNFRWKASAGNAVRHTNWLLRRLPRGLLRRASAKLSLEIPSRASTKACARLRDAGFSLLRLSIWSSPQSSILTNSKISPLRWWQIVMVDGSVSGCRAVHSSVGGGGNDDAVVLCCFVLLLLF